MPKPMPKLDWQTDDEEAWQAGQSSTTQAGPTPQRTRVAIFGLAAALAILLITGGWLARRPGISATVRDGSSGIVAQASEVVTQSVPVQGVAHFANGLQVGKVERQSDRMMVQVIAYYPENGTMRPYRETRFYAKNGATWQDSDPDPTLLGPVQSLTVANFTILYRAADADAVYQAVPQLEELYAALRQDEGLPAVVPGVAYTLEISAGDRPGGNYYDYSQRTLAIYSPSLLSAPIEITPATLIEQATIYPLAQLLMHELLDQHDTHWQSTFSQWWPIENALPLWELWQGQGPIAVSRHSIVPWLYHNSQSASGSRPLPDDYVQLCRLYHIWQLLPADLAIPLACNQGETNVLPFNGNPAPATTWPQLIFAPGRSIVLTPSADSNNVTLASILDYIVATYGRDKLPQLLVAMGEHSSPDTLIPALFGVSRSAFEAGWQAYLAQHT